MRAKFVTFEGVEGAGKSTQIHLVEKHFSAQGRKVLVTREPGGTLVGNELRDILLRKRVESLEPLTELFLMEAARVQHTAFVLRPALGDYDLILCDRYADATLAYQGGGRGFDLDWLRELNHRATFELVPDLTILLDMPVETGLPRAKSRFQDSDEDEDRFENETESFHDRVRETYLKLARQEPNRFFVIDAARTMDDLTKEIVSRIEILYSEEHD